MAGAFFERLRLAWWRYQQARFEASRERARGVAERSGERDERAEPRLAGVRLAETRLAAAVAEVVVEAAVAAPVDDAELVVAPGPTAPDGGEAGPTGPLLDYVYLRGTRELRTLTAYFSRVAGAVHSDFKVMEQGVALPLHHSVFARHALLGLPQSVQRNFRRLGYRAQHFDSALTRLPKLGRAVWVLNFQADFSYGLYALNNSSHSVPLAVPEFRRNLTDVTKLDPPPPGIGADMLAVLREKFQFSGMIGEADFKANLRLMLQQATPDTRVFILLAPLGVAQDGNVAAVSRRKAQINQWQVDVAGEVPAITLLNMGDFIASGGERIEFARIFDTIMRGVGVEARRAAAE